MSGDRLRAASSRPPPQLRLLLVLDAAGREKRRDLAPSRRRNALLDHLSRMAATSRPGASPRASEDSRHGRAASAAAARARWPIASLTSFQTPARNSPPSRDPACRRGSDPRAHSSRTSRRARSKSSACAISSATSKRAGALASKGNRCSSLSQKAWMVWILRPPGVSTVRAKSSARRGSSPSRGRVRRAGRDDRLAQRSVVEPSPQSELSKTRIAILAAAAFVKVRQRIFAGATPLQQQPDDALGKHMRLARSRIGGDPDGGGRVRGLALLLERLRRDVRQTMTRRPPPRRQATIP